MVSEIHPWKHNAPEKRIWEICAQKLTKAEAEAHLKSQIAQFKKEPLGDFDP